MFVHVCCVFILSLTDSVMSVLCYVLFRRNLDLHRKFQCWHIFYYQFLPQMLSPYIKEMCCVIIYCYRLSPYLKNTFFSYLSKLCSNRQIVECLLDTPTRRKGEIREEENMTSLPPFNPISEYAPAQRITIGLNFFDHPCTLATMVTR